MRKTLLKGLLKAPFTERAPADAEFAAFATKVDQAARARLGRSLSIRQIDAGSCNGCELEIHALSNAFYDIERFGMRFVASPRHADVLMVTGAVTHNMAIAATKTYDAMPLPKFVVAVGDDACNGGIFAGTYAVLGGADKLFPVDLKIPGNPPAPKEILAGLLALMKQAHTKP